MLKYSCKHQYVIFFERMVNMALNIFSPWIELYRGKDEAHYSDLVALLTLHDIRHKAIVAQPGNKMATYSGASGTFAGNPGMSRSGYTNPATLNAGRDSSKADDAPKVYTVRIRRIDRAKVKKLQAAHH